MHIRYASLICFPGYSVDADSEDPDSEKKYWMKEFVNTRQICIIELFPSILLLLMQTWRCQLLKKSIGNCQACTDTAGSWSTTLVQNSSPVLTTGQKHQNLPSNRRTDFQAVHTEHLAICTLLLCGRGRVIRKNGPPVHPRPGCLQLQRLIQRSHRFHLAELYHLRLFVTNTTTLQFCPRLRLSRI